MSLDPLSALMTTATRSPEMSGADWEIELARLAQRNRAIQSCVTGNLDVDVLLDLLAEHCIDPDEWIEVSEENLSQILIYG